MVPQALLMGRADTAHATWCQWLLTLPPLGALSSMTQMPAVQQSSLLRVPRAPEAGPTDDGRAPSRPSQISNLTPAMGLACLVPQR